MMSRRNRTRLALLIAVVVGPAALTGCAPLARAFRAGGPPPASPSATADCAQLEMAASAAALDAAGGGVPTDSVGAAMAASMAQSRAAIAENEYRNCVASHH